ncbi:hypothetical protein ACVC7V_21335 [Hydrogenophaga sp. A37]|uniref:hypothetical protein n=1 Tax=Hydrogenophaga sp. A37 TaxID=1945864 RepID=UPI0009844B68|nr:hypothetical protein [Hydrogenophaga sp. A37]OOG81540.1 hypothetical protein B0E41_17420 [Hydrogenophaga sp. A37]
MNTETLESAAATLQLNDAQMRQQADLIVRLMGMAQIGVPTPDEGAVTTRPGLALMALAAAFKAISAARPECTLMGAEMAFGMGRMLVEIHEKRTTPTH